jgi:hypothetical protein
MVIGAPSDRRGDGHLKKPKSAARPPALKKLRRLTPAGEKASIDEGFIMIHLA